MSLITSRASNGRNPAVQGIACSNLASSDISAGNRIVSRWTSSTNAVGRVEADENQIGVQLPAVGDRLLGVLQLSGSDAVLAANEDAVVVTGGRARLWVKVPANVSLPKGTGLVPAMAWDGTNKVSYFGTSLVSSVAQNVGYAEAVIKGSAIYQPANPIAYLSKALTATSSDTYQLAEVEVDFGHKPLAFSKNILTLATPANLTRFTAHVPMGPMVITAAWMQALDWTGTGACTLDLHNCPLGTTADPTSMFSTNPSLDSAGSPSDGAVLFSGCGNTTALCALNGDTDTTVAIGTAGTNGVLAAIGKRTLISNSILAATISGTPASMAQMQIGIEGYYL